ncbi:glutaredoxin family protein [Gracilibacillus kekensis]|uniref:Thioredoxin domain-containing protein n=1 Tax=Gracilibacillus kekensis TaxID=1027249 RepID=A0A1M7KE86_9BACI|nr:glutaredoxin family protein [Gracilibacillus kekensis]SHM63577.1 Thioredoxin domain-containing protein [Gracilibacillus kekensis]
MKKTIKVYISENNKECDQLINYLNKYNVSFLTINVTENKDALYELQKENIYLTPAIIIDDKNHIIGYHPESIDKHLFLMPKK